MVLALARVLCVCFRWVAGTLDGRVLRRFSDQISTLLVRVLRQNFTMGRSWGRGVRVNFFDYKKFCGHGWSSKIFCRIFFGGRVSSSGFLAVIFLFWVTLVPQKNWSWCFGWGCFPVCVYRQFLVWAEGHHKFLLCFFCHGLDLVLCCRLKNFWDVLSSNFFVVTKIFNFFLGRCVGKFIEKSCVIKKVICYFCLVALPDA